MRDQNITLLHLALDEVDAAIAANPSHPAGYLAIRGSIHRARGKLLKAVKDHKQCVALRTAVGNDAAKGEALTELGWSYAWTLRLGGARKCLADGLALMRARKIESPAAAGFLVRALRKHAVVQLLTLDVVGSRRSLSEARQITQQYFVHDQQRGLIK